MESVPQTEYTILVNKETGKLALFDHNNPKVSVREEESIAGDLMDIIGEFVIRAIEKGENFFYPGTSREVRTFFRKCHIHDNPKLFKKGYRSLKKEEKTRLYQDVIEESERERVDFF